MSSKSRKQTGESARKQTGEPERKVLTINLFATPDQIEVCTSKARYISLFAGRRWGKMYVAVNRILLKMMLPGFRYEYIAPTYAQVIKLFEMIRDHKSLKPLIKSSKLQPYPHIVFRTGAVLSCRSFDRPEKLRGDCFDEIWVDEIQDQCYSEKLFNGVIKPMTADRRGTVIISGQFAGKDDWRYQHFVKGCPFLEDGVTDNSKYNVKYRSFHFPSHTGLKFQSAVGREELAQLEASTPPHEWRREYLCIPEEVENGAFIIDDINACMAPNTASGAFNRSSLSALQGHQYIMAMDIGKTRDHSAIVVLDQTTGVIAYAERLPLGMSHDNQAKHASMIQKRFGDCPIWLDASGGATGGHKPTNVYLDLYRKSLVRVNEVILTWINKNQMMGLATLAMQQRTVSIPDDTPDQQATAGHKALVLELKNYTMTVSGGFTKFHAPDGQHDDLCVAFLMVLWGRNERPVYSNRTTPYGFN